jgi:amino acid permease
MEDTRVKDEPKTYESQSPEGRDHDVEVADAGIKHKGAPLSRALQGRHMQMIAIGEFIPRWSVLIMAEPLS